MSLPAVPQALAPWLAIVTRYQRHLSAAATVGGFAFDNYFFGRIDHPATQIVLVSYLVLAAGAIALLHFIESNPDQHLLPARGRPLLLIAAQFAMGSLWSAFLVFYARSAILPASWPFLLVLGAMLVGNDVFREYHSRLTFTAIML